MKRNRAFVSPDEILNVSSNSGSIIDKWKNPLTVTDVDVVKEGELRSMKFNSLTSGIDCGIINDLSTDITVLTWINPKSFGENNAGHIISADVDKFNLLVTSGDDRIGFTRDTANHAYTANDSVIVNKPIFIAVTSTAAGATNMYINAELSGSADQAAGSCSVDTNIFIGNRSSDDRSFDGLISEPRIIEGILTVNEISQAFSSERKLYRV